MRSTFGSGTLHTFLLRTSPLFFNIHYGYHHHLLERGGQCIFRILADIEFKKNQAIGYENVE